MLGRRATHLVSSVGAESNAAIGLVRLGVSAGWVSRVGDDEFGHYVRAAVRGEDVDVSHVGLDPDRPTGIMIKELRRVGRSRGRHELFEHTAADFLRSLGDAKGAT